MIDLFSCAASVSDTFWSALNFTAFSSFFSETSAACTASPSSAREICLEVTADT